MCGLPDMDLANITFSEPLLKFHHISLKQALVVHVLGTIYVSAEVHRHRVYFFLTIYRFCFMCQWPWDSEQFAGSCSCAGLLIHCWSLNSLCCWKWGWLLPPSPLLSHEIRSFIWEHGLLTADALLCEQWPWSCWVHQQAVAMQRAVPCNPCCSCWRDFSLQPDASGRCPADGKGPQITPFTEFLLKEVERKGVISPDTFKFLSKQTPNTLNLCQNTF